MVSRDRQKHLIKGIWRVKSLRHVTWEATREKAHWHHKRTLHAHPGATSGMADGTGQLQKVEDQSPPHCLWEDEAGHALQETVQQFLHSAIPRFPPKKNEVYRWCVQERSP